MNRRNGILLAVIACMAALLLAVGCAQQPAGTSSTAQASDSQASQEAEGQDHAGNADDAQAEADAVADAEGQASDAPADAGAQEGAAEAVDSSEIVEPIVKEVNGVKIQRTPSEMGASVVLDTSYSYHSPALNVPYNTNFLHADERGCNACHDDLAETLNGMTYPHTDLANSMGIQLTVEMCKDCHTFGYGYITNQNQFGDMIHGIHFSQDRASCWNCHVGNGDGKGMQLWDEVMYNQLRGITAVADAPGDFSWDQDKTTPVDELFDFDWNYFDLDYQRHDNTVNNVPLDQELFDSWTITVSGAVDHEVTYTMPELIEKFDSVTRPITFSCTLNPTGGPFIGNSVYTGIPIKALLEEAGYNETECGGFNFAAPDGFLEPLTVENYDGGAILAYQIDGQPLPWSQGYPVQLIAPHSGAPASVKSVSDIIVLTKEEAAEVHEWNGWPNETESTNYYTPEAWPYVDSAGYKNKPNVGLFDFTEGMVIETGKPYEFSGYAYGYEEQIVAVEISLDGGATWRTFDTSGSNKDNWVVWRYTFTPEEDSGYVIMVRSVSDTGRVTEEPLEMLFNSQSV